MLQSYLLWLSILGLDYALALPKLDLRSNSVTTVSPTSVYSPPVVAVARSLSSGKPAKAVFAHYMVGTITEDHARQDVQSAYDLGLDAFALNIGDATQQWVKDALGVLFSAAEDVGFKLFLSMDMDASGGACSGSCTSCGGADDYTWILEQYSASSAYYHVGTAALVSTFSSGGLQSTHWQYWLSNLTMPIYFMPDFDDTQGYYDADPAWWSYWGDTVSGLFSWESSWPIIGSGTTAGSVDRDVVVLAGAAQRNKAYMIGLSPLQYKDAYGTNNYRQGGVNLPLRMQNILNMQTQPDFVEFITWNDKPESHYIAEIWPESNIEYFPSLYANPSDWDHTGWQSLLASFIVAFKSSSTTMTPVAGQQVTGAMWYKTILQSATCTADLAAVPSETASVNCNGVTISPADPSGYFAKPNGFDEGEDSINWAVVVPADGAAYTLEIYSNDVMLNDVTLNTGLNFGSQGTVLPGSQYMVLKRDASTIAKAEGGKDIKSTCTDHIYNMNYQVVGLKGD